MTTEPMATRYPPAPAGRDGGRHPVDLLAAIRGFQRALAAPWGDPGWWRGVATELPRLRASFTTHVELTEGPAGLYDEVLADAPRLARQVAALRREHTVVCAALEALVRRVDGPPDQVRGWGTDLLRVLARHRQRGADLVYAAYLVDLGGET